MGKRKRFSSDKKRDVVLMLLRKEESAAVLARRYNVSEQTLYRWRDEFIKGGESALGSKADGNERIIKELRSEIEERDRVIGEITIANRILKKRADRLS